jgi:hypothetical protein
LRLERQERVWPAALYAALLSLVVFWAWRRRRFVPLGPSLLAAGAYHALFLAGGNVYSLSGIVSQEQFVSDVVTRGLAGLLLGWLWLVRWPYAGRADLTRRTLRYGWLTLGILGLVLAALYVWNGPTVRWTLPDFLAHFLTLITLAQFMVVAAGTLPLAGLAALLAPLLSRLRLTRPTLPAR